MKENENLPYNWLVKKREKKENKKISIKTMKITWYTPKQLKKQLLTKTHSEIRTWFSFNKIQLIKRNKKISWIKKYKKVLLG